MNGENRLLVTDEAVEFEKYLIQVPDFKKIIHLFRAIYGVYLQLIKKKLKDVNM